MRGCLKFLLVQSRFVMGPMSQLSKLKKSAHAGAALCVNLFPYLDMI